MGMQLKCKWDRWGILFITIAISTILALLILNKVGGAENFFNLLVYLGLIVLVIAYCTNQQMPMLSIENDKFL